ncbi:MAG: threonine synthase [Proteobacteria bacterium]|nr:threonine synthase [Pseudomonadota bacterium]
MRSLLTHLECGRCETSHDFRKPHRVCTECGGPLLARYRITPGAVSIQTVMSRRPGQHRLPELSPVQGAEMPTLGEGATPLLKAHGLAVDLDLPNLLIKDEAQNPTGSFKARGMALATARARELGIGRVCLPSAGNAGAAAAAYGALHGLDVHVYVPESTPKPIQGEVVAMGANVVTVDGSIANAGAALKPVAESNGWFPLSTLKEPYRIEGKKVMGYELFYDLGRLPDVILYPTGGGTGLIGMWKAFDEMERLGWIGPERPRMVVVQTTGCAPIVKAFKRKEWDGATPIKNPKKTAAFGLRVPGALGDFLMLRCLRDSRGTAIAIDEIDLLDGAKAMAQKLGIQCSAEGGACVAAARQLRSKGWIDRNDITVIFNTGHALNYGE